MSDLTYISKAVYICAFKWSNDFFLMSLHTLMTIVSSAGRATLHVLGTSFAAITQRSRSTARLRLHLSHMSLHALHLLTGQKSRSTVKDFMCYSHMDECSTRSMPWACSHCANTRFSGQGQAATFSYTKAAGSIKVWSDTAAWLLMVHFTSRQPFTQCYDHKLFVLRETIRGMHTYVELPQWPLWW